MEAELLTQYETQLLAKEHSGAAALLRDDKVRGRGEGARRGMLRRVAARGLSLIHISQGIVR